MLNTNTNLFEFLTSQVGRSGDRATGRREFTSRGWKISLSIIFLSCIFNQSFAQNNNNTYTEYHVLVNTAENKITALDYQEALKVYHEAFKNDYTFAQDLYNASLCAMQVKDFDATLKFCEGLVKRGCTIKFFSTYKFKPFRESAQWEIFSKKYPSFVESYNSTCRKDLVAEIEKLNELDQGNYKLLPNNVHNQDFQDSLKNLSDYVKLKLMNLFNQSGYLDESIIGARIESDTTLGILPIFAFLIRHRYQVNKYDYSPYLISEFNKGKIKPEVLASWLDLELKGAIGSVPALIYNCQLYFEKFPGKKETVIFNREKYLLPKLEDTQKKIIFKKCYNNDFLFFTPTGRISDIDENTKKILKEQSEIHEQSVLNCF